MQKILAFSTIQKDISVILQENDRIIYFQNTETDKQSELLVTTLNNVLKKNNLDYSDIYAFATIVGPGNFTSIKTSIAVLKALKLATGKKIITTNMFEIVGTNIIKQNDSKYYIKQNDVYSTVSNIDDYKDKEVVFSDGTFSKETWAKINYEKFLKGEFSENVEPLYIEPPKVTCRKK